MPLQLRWSLQGIKRSKSSYMSSCISSDLLPDAVVDERTSSAHPDQTVHGRGTYAMVDIASSSKRRHHLGGIRNHLYTASKDVRRAPDGGYVMRMKPQSAEARISVSACPSTSATTNSAGVMGHLRRAIAMMRMRINATQSGYQKLKKSVSTSKGSSWVPRH